MGWGQKIGMVVSVLWLAQGIINSTYAYLVPGSNTTAKTASLAPQIKAAPPKTSYNFQEHLLMSIYRNLTASISNFIGLSSLVKTAGLEKHLLTTGPAASSTAATTSPASSNYRIRRPIEGGVITSSKTTAPITLSINHSVYTEHLDEADLKTKFIALKNALKNCGAIENHEDVRVNVDLNGNEGVFIASDGISRIINLAEARKDPEVESCFLQVKEVYEKALTDKAVKEIEESLLSNNHSVEVDRVKFTYTITKTKDGSKEKPLSLSKEHVEKLNNVKDLVNFGSLQEGHFICRHSSGEVGQLSEKVAARYAEGWIRNSYSSTVDGNERADVKEQVKKQRKADEDAIAKLQTSISSADQVTVLKESKARTDELAALLVIKGSNSLSELDDYMSNAERALMRGPQIVYSEIQKKLSQEVKDALTAYQTAKKLPAGTSGKAVKKSDAKTVLDQQKNKDAFAASILGVQSLIEKEEQGIRNRTDQGGEGPIQYATSRIVDLDRELECLSLGSNRLGIDQRMKEKLNLEEKKECLEILERVPLAKSIYAIISQDITKMRAKGVDFSSSDGKTQVQQLFERRFAELAKIARGEKGVPLNPKETQHFLEIFMLAANSISDLKPGGDAERVAMEEAMQAVTKKNGGTLLASIPNMKKFL